ncbi:hypothetical protein E2542_SST19084 [Spatholobus suberectus]|nr:hypothetical protein E2542_SST19084 [Spatholobus suberectus]
MYVETVSASFSHPLPQMWFPLSIFFLPCPDLVGFGPFCMNKTYPLALIACDSQIPSPTDLILSLCKDVRFSYFSFSFYDGGFILCFYFVSQSVVSYFMLTCGRFIAEERIFFLDNLCCSFIPLSAHNT